MKAVSKYAQNSTSQQQRLHGVGQQLGGGGHGDALLVAQLEEPALPAQVALPELAVRGATGHGAQQEGVDLDHLLHALGSCRMGVNCGYMVS